MSIPQDYNPFSREAIHIPKVYRGDLELYSSTGNPGNKEEVPFNRYIDFWLLAAAMGASSDIFTPLDTSSKHRFIDGYIFQRDMATIRFLLLLAISHTGDPFVVEEPRKVIDIAEGYAAGGIPLVTEMMQTGHLTTVQNLLRSLYKKLSPDG